MSRLSWLCALLVLAPLCALAAAAPPDAVPGTATAAAAQVKRGEVLYFQACAICHGDRLEGQIGPALSGDDFRATFGGGQVAALHTLITTTMPDDRPGSLSAQEALDVTAYLLVLNGLPRPAAELKAGTLEAPALRTP
ncbi:c-type cytochrome [Deinococcus sp. KSM4-11]|uniref:c-type cytochrome n=1 Tax=Deinococcus sp. KSM4-11 TaxID=2568654 RepID=UPI001454CF85|nr:c-type cytochrome [Deinococcus sp. KSM4-11]